IMAPSVPGPQRSTTTAARITDGLIKLKVIVAEPPERVDAVPAALTFLSISFDPLPDVRAGQAAAIPVAGGITVENATIADVDGVLAKPGPGGRPIVYAHASPNSNDWRTWQASLALPALSAGDYSLFADGYGKDATGKSCYTRASATLNVR